MQFLIQEIKEKNIWENFLRECKEKTFLNSWLWGEFQKELGNKIWRFGVFSNGKLVSSVLIVKIVAKRGKFLFLPHCPNIKGGFEHSSFEITKTLFDFLKELAKKEKVDFIRIAPIQKRTKENEKIFKDLGFRDAPIHIHPEVTWELNISLPESVLLSQMRKTTRYLIKKLQKEKELTILEENNLEGLNKFYQIYQETKERQKFFPYSYDYLKKEFSTFSEDNSAFILLASFKKEIVSGGIFIAWQNTCYYHHGASSKKFLKLPTSYLLIWEAIKKAKERNCERFNFWGIAPRDYKFKIFGLNLFPHPWLGLTLFKTGFGGEKKEYVLTKDYPITLKYWLNFLIEKMRKAKRNL